jgi:hypothetical protein
LTIKQIAPFVPQFCGLFPDPHENFKHVEQPTRDSILFFAQQVPGSRLKDLAIKECGYEAVRYAVGRIWAALPVIHKHWGFSGGIDKEGVFYDFTTKKITILNWDRGQLPLYHIRGYHHGLTHWESKDRFMCVYKTYGKRILNGFGSAESLNAVDKEALLNCLLECRVISRAAEMERMEKMGKNAEACKDVLRTPLRRYTQEISARNYPLYKLDQRVTLLLEILLGDGDDREMATRIRNACICRDRLQPGKRKPVSYSSEFQS